MSGRARSDAAALKSPVCSVNGASGGAPALSNSSSAAPGQWLASSSVTWQAEPGMRTRTFIGSGLSSSGRTRSRSATSAAVTSLQYTGPASHAAVKPM